MIGEDTCCGATRAMISYARAMMRGEDTPLLGRDGIGAADRLFIANRRPDDSLDVVGSGLEPLFDLGEPVSDLGRMFSPPDRRLGLALLDSVAATGEPGVVRAHGLALSGARIDIELMLSPLPAFWSRGDRFLGHAALVGYVAAPIITRLTIGALLTPASPIPTRPRPNLRLVVSNA
jgi:hypothetical protein